MSIFLVLLAIPHAPLDVRLVRVVLLQQPLVLRVQLGRHSLAHFVNLQNHISGDMMENCAI